jgi:hypothetical protein
MIIYIGDPIQQFKEYLSLSLSLSLPINKIYTLIYITTVLISWEFLEFEIELLLRNQ